MFSGTSVGRATAALTGSSTEDFTTAIDMRNTLDGKLTINLAFTIGSLTSCTWRVLAGTTATPTTTVWDGAQALTGSLTSTQTISIVVDVPGYRYIRLGLTGVGTTGASDAVVNYYYNDYQTTTAADGALRVD